MRAFKISASHKHSSQAPLPQGEGSECLHKVRHRLSAIVLADFRLRVLAKSKTHTKNWPIISIVSACGVTTPAAYREVQLSRQRLVGKVYAVDVFANPGRDQKSWCHKPHSDVDRAPPMPRSIARKVITNHCELGWN